MPTNKKTKGTKKKATKQERAAIVLGANGAINVSMFHGLTKEESPSSRSCSHGSIKEEPKFESDEWYDATFASRLVSSLQEILATYEEMAEKVILVTAEVYSWMGDLPLERFDLILERARSLILSIATHAIIERDTSDNFARALAFAVIQLEQQFHGDLPLFPDADKKRGREQCALLRDTLDGGELVVTAFYAKRIPCSCLDEKHAALKALPKMSRCAYCRRIRLRSDLMLCVRCKFVHYCSEQCQRADWKNGHEELCTQFLHKKRKVLNVLD
eukprot:scaffold2049_cov108-Cylindrotheca_fusiformis.AAC.2